MAVKVFRRRKKRGRKIEDEVELKQGGPGCTVQPPVVALLRVALDASCFQNSTTFTVHHAGSGLNLQRGASAECLQTLSHSKRGLFLPLSLPVFYLHVYVRP